MKTAIIGSGGVGGYFGAKLAQAGNEVTFLARGAHKEAMQTHGLKVKSVNGDFEVKNIKVTDQIKEIGQVDLIIIAVKAWQIKELREELNSILHDETLIIPLQNGVMAADELKEVISGKQVLGGVCRIISKIESPGVIHHIGIEPTILFGAFNKEENPTIQKVKAAFDQAGINSRISRDIEADLWKKFIGICVSGLLAVTHTTYGECRELPETRQMMIDLLTEIYHLASAKGVDLKADIVEKTITAIDAYPYKSTSSLTRDVMEGKPSEIEYQNGTVVKLGKELGVEVPVNRFVYSCVLPREIKARK